MKNLFIDTNVFLSFFHYSSDDLKELEKLIVLIKPTEIILYLTEQVVDEFNRNRETRIQDALKIFTNEKLVESFPQICKEYPEYGDVRNALSNYKELKNVLLEKMNKDIINRKLKADEIIESIFEKAEYIEISEEILNYAKDRLARGNPPGKNGSLGDAINWESLLVNIPDKQDLYLISDDRDYASLLDSESMNPFLKSEWYSQINSKIYFYKKLSAFLKEHYPNINLEDEQLKETLITALKTSPNFSASRTLLWQLNKHSNFSRSQLNDIVLSSISNNQIYWIIKDEDINSIIRHIIEGKEHLIDIDNLQKLLRLLNE